jgi:hypothetical protein
MLVGAGCPGSSDEKYSPPPSGAAVCQDGIACCQEDELVCVGNPDSTTVCRCFKAWDCESAVDPKKCWQNKADVPDGNGDWTCQSQGNVEKCVRPGSDVPPSKNGWICKATGSGVECTRTTNTPDGTTNWNCSYSGEFKSCIKSGGTVGGDAGPYQDGSGVQADQGPTPTGDIGLPKGWNCATNNLGEMVCKKAGAGVPPGGGTFKCSWKANKITCEGSSAQPPGGMSGWQCVENELIGWRCTKTITPDDYPDGTGGWNCYSGSDFNGTVCVKPPPPQQGKECNPGTKKWCDGLTYCGWGQVTCGPDGKWKTRTNPQTGQPELDCWELTDGRRPNTKCACHFFYWNKDCCETPSCVVPPSTNGQICPKSAGKYCDYCNPNAPECINAGSKCVVTTNNETFCGIDCAGGKGCPAGSSCQKLQIDNEYYWQCIPNDLSCYY